MTLMTLAVTVRYPDKQPVRSKVLVDMDKFIYATDCDDGLINVRFEGPVSLTVSKSDFTDVLLKVGICQRDIPSYMPSNQT